MEIKIRNLEEIRIQKEVQGLQKRILKLRQNLKKKFPNIGFNYSIRIRHPSGIYFTVRFYKSKTTSEWEMRVYKTGKIRQNLYPDVTDKVDSSTLNELVELFNLEERKRALLKKLNLKRI